MRSLVFDREQLKQMAEIDIRSVSVEDLVDITALDEHVPDEEQTERIQHFMRAVKNPYCFRVGKIAVKSSFGGAVSLQQRIQEMINGI
ncbi:MAG: hypothetical protein HFH80_00285 [Lachnospiraceae bacterium]|nr:hypothetical protein [Lachnospiraceae bacterium]